MFITIRVSLAACIRLMSFGMCTKDIVLRPRLTPPGEVVAHLVAAQCVSYAFLMTLNSNTSVVPTSSDI